MPIPLFLPLVYYTCCMKTWMQSLNNHIPAFGISSLQACLLLLLQTCLKEVSLRSQPLFRRASFVSAAVSSSSLLG